MDKEYRNLLRHAETENDFIKVERIQIRKGLRTQIIIINITKKEEYRGTETFIRNGTDARPGAGTWINANPSARIMSRNSTCIGTKTWILDRTQTRINGWVRNRTEIKA